MFQIPRHRCDNANTDASGHMQFMVIDLERITHGKDDFFQRRLCITDVIQAGNQRGNSSPDNLKHCPLPACNPSV